MVLVTWPSQHSGWRVGGGGGRGGAGPSRPARPPKVTLGTLACSSPRSGARGAPTSHHTRTPHAQQRRAGQEGTAAAPPGLAGKWGLGGHCLSAPSMTFLA